MDTYPSSMPPPLDPPNFLPSLRVLGLVQFRALTPHNRHIRRGSTDLPLGTHTVERDANAWTRPFRTRRPRRYGFLRSACDIAHALSLISHGDGCFASEGEEV